ncbi:MAG: hypothetical protein ACJA0Q_000030 [Saprospiraceae bacterium]|jgi:hypothetical protein
MKKDIILPKVNNVHVAVVKEKNDEGEFIWNVYLINKQDFTLENVLVSSSGYRTDSKGNKQNSSTLRHFLENVPAHSAKKIEPIMEDVFRLNNEYFVTYFSSEGMAEKQFVFVPDSILEKNFIEIPFTGEQGVMI